MRTVQLLKMHTQIIPCIWLRLIRVCIAKKCTEITYPIYTLCILNAYRLAYCFSWVNFWPLSWCGHGFCVPAFVYSLHTQKIPKNMSQNILSPGYEGSTTVRNTYSNYTVYLAPSHPGMHCEKVYLNCIPYSYYYVYHKSTLIIPA